MHTWNYSLILQAPRHIHMYRYMSEKDSHRIYWFVSKEVLQSSIISASHLITSKTNRANSQPGNPPVWQKEANLCIGDMVCGE